MFRKEWLESERYLDFSLQSAFARELGDLAATTASQGLGARENLARKDCLSIALMHKARVSFEAVQLLCKFLLVGDARAIIRTMCEAIINGAYISNATDEVADNYVDFPDYWRWIEYTELRASAPEMPYPFEESELEHLRTRYGVIKHRFGGFKRGEWCADNLFRRAAYLDSLVGDSSSLFRWLVNLIWRQASAYVHGAPQSIGVEGSGRDPRTLTQRTPEEAARTLHIAVSVMLVWFPCFGEYLNKGWEERCEELMERMGSSASVGHESAHIAAKATLGDS